MIPRMFTRSSLVSFTRRSSSRRPAAPLDEGVQDVLRRLQEAEREVARTIASLDEIAALLRGRAPGPEPTPAPDAPGLRRSVPPR